MSVPVSGLFVAILNLWNINTRTSLVDLRPNNLCKKQQLKAKYLRMRWGPQPTKTKPIINKIPEVGPAGAGSAPASFWAFLFRGACFTWQHLHSTKYSFSSSSSSGSIILSKVGYNHWSSQYLLQFSSCSVSLETSSQASKLISKRATDCQSVTECRCRV